MKTKLIASVVAVAGILSTSAAWAANSCVWIRNIDDFKSANDEKSLIIRDSPSRKYNVTLVGRCTGLRYTETLGLRSFGDMFCLTPGDSILFRDGGISRRCMISKIEPIAPPAADQATRSDGDQSEGH
jgi:hypothetical protein